jgi:predicted O-methyltransferase YrrM
MEVAALPTGFLRIRRNVFENWPVETAHKGNRVLPLYFGRDVYEGDRRGGDIRFGMEWRARGGKCYAAADLVLGHCGKTVIRDSLAATIRRRNGQTLKYVADRVKAGDESLTLIREATQYLNNEWGAPAELLRVAIGLARASDGPIIEAGSGLSTILMAAATDQRVYCMENSQRHALHLREMVAEAKVGKVYLSELPLRDGWYDMSGYLPLMPRQFGLGFVDGPPRYAGDRMRFFDVFGARCRVVVVDDADDPDFLAKVRAWASEQGRETISDGRGAVILPHGVTP